jgi:vacuolar-type H+-ATPase subunit I/STV1
MDTSIIIYNPPESNIAVNLQADLDARTIWATQKQIADTLNLSVPTVNEHIANFKKQRGDAAKRSIRKFRILAEDGKQREIEHHDMTVIAYVGFRAQATDRVIQFQDWVGTQLERAAAPVTSTQALLQAVQILAELEQRDMQRERELQELREDHANEKVAREDAIAAINARLDDKDYYTVLQWCRLQKINYTPTILNKWGKRCSALSRELVYEIKNVNEEGTYPIGRYHKDILLQVCRPIEKKSGQLPLL